MEYNKLVRDKIPQIIKDSGKTAVTRVADEAEYLQYLRAKLQEETAEYLQSGDAEELADILEVVLALAKAGGCSEQKLYALRKDKADKRGGFDEKILLLQVKE